MKKRMMCLMLMALCVILTGFVPGVFAGEQELKLASWGSPKHYGSIELTKWIADVNTASAGKVKIVDYPGGQLYGPSEMHMALAKGTVDMGVVLQPAMMAVVPMLQGVYLPFAFDNLDHAAKAYTGESLAIIEKAMEKKKIKHVWTIFGDGVHLYSAKKSIETLDDLKGLRILSSSPVITRIFADLGAAPDSSIPNTELYMALKRGVSDAVANSIVGGFFGKSYEVAPYVTKMDMSFATMMICMNLDKWNKLPKEVQDVMRDLGEKASESTLASGKAWETKFTDEMVKVGGIVTRIPPEERAKIKKVSQSLWDEWAQKNGPDAQRLLELNAN
ncbi:MAG: hypothetical protein A2277_06690 [Desulfobacterales bacterium RIFOXYA12_FULL_46_15]|nr:MAG: hypothetical protein A2277_06690 [Desulfobacterales bacterium RIFOXYA12_FULL_46_15]